MPRQDTSSKLPLTGQTGEAWVSPNIRGTLSKVWEYQDGKVLPSFRSSEGGSCGLLGLNDSFAAHPYVHLW